MKSLRQPRRHPVTLRLLACWALLAWLSLAMPAATAQEASAAQRGSITRVQSDNFTFYGDMPQVRASQLMTDLEQFRFAMRDLYNVPETRQDQHVRIYYITNAKVFAAQATTVNFAAFYSNSDLGPEIVINGARSWQDGDLLKSALFHEYMHHFNLWYVDYNLPTWLNEGLAEYYGIFSVTPDGRYKIGDVQLERLTSLTSEDWLPLEGLFQTLHGYPASMDRYRAGTNPKAQSFFYAQSWIIVHYLENTPRGMDKLRAFTKALTPDSDIAQTFETHFGQDLESFLSVLKNYVSAGALPVKLVQPRRAQSDITPRVSTVTQRIFNQELYLLTSPVQDVIADAVRTDLRAKLEASGDLPAHVYAGDALAAFRSFDYYAAQEHIETALSLDPNEPRYHVLGALIAFYDWQESYNDNIVGRVRATLKSAIERAPDYPELRSMFIITHDPDTDSVPQDVIASLDHLMSHNYPVMNPDNAPTLISALLVLKRYDEILNILDITETWSENSERRLRANRLRYDIEREKRRANR